MQLTRQQKLNFHRDGYIKISGAVPQRMVEQALRAINHSLGVEGMNKEEAEKGNGHALIMMNRGPMKVPAVPAGDDLLLRHHAHQYGYLPPGRRSVLPHCATVSFSESLPSDASSAAMVPATPLESDAQRKTVPGAIGVFVSKSVTP